MAIIPRVSDDGKQNRATPALAYARRGIPVFPLHSVDGRGRCSCGGPEANPKCKPGKHPRIRHGHNDATTDPARIREWWGRWPDANIGIPTGKRSGLLSLDIDTYNWGAGSLEALEDANGELPETAAFQTGRGGMQLVFRYPADGPSIRNSTGQLGRGLDVRGEGGYIVGPPSRTQGPYEWLERRPLSDPPDWLLKALQQPQSASDGACSSNRRPTVSATPDGPPIPNTTRNTTLTSIAGALRARGMELEGMDAHLQAVNAARCEPPLPEAEVSGIARSVARYPAGDAAPTPDRETLEAVTTLFADVLERLEWKGRSGPTDHAVYAALLITARQYGRRIRFGVKVYISVRALALAAGTTRRTVIKALKRLAKAKLVYRASAGQGTNAGALVLRVPQDFTTQPRGGCTDSGERLREVLRELLRVRWGPGRMGKSGALYLEHLYRLGSATVRELSERTGRRPDNVRRSLRKLEPRALVECLDGEYRLVPEFTEALARELELDGVPEAERLQSQHYELQRAAYVEHLEKRRRRRRKPDGLTSELEPVQASVQPAPDALITDPNDPERFRELSALARERIAGHRSGQKRATLLLRRLRRDDHECFAALRSDPRALAWEVSGRGWTETIYCGNTIRSALEVLDRELDPAGAVA